MSIFSSSVEGGVKKRYWHRCLPVNIGKLFKKLFYKLLCWLFLLIKRFLAKEYRSILKDIIVIVCSQTCQRFREINDKQVGLFFKLKRLWGGVRSKFLGNSKTQKSWSQLKVDKFCEKSPIFMSSRIAVLDQLKFVQLEVPHYYQSFHLIKERNNCYLTRFMKCFVNGMHWVAGSSGRPLLTCGQRFT